MRDQLGTRHLVEQIAVPTLIFHGAEDQTIPLHCDQALADMSDTAQIYVIPDGTHTDLWSHGLRDRIYAHLPQN